MTETIVNESASVENVEKKYAETVFKSAYYHGQHMLNFFLNFNAKQNPNAFSIIIRKGKFNSVYNLTEAETVSYVRSILGSVSPEMLNTILQGMK